MIPAPVAYAAAPRPRGASKPWWFGNWAGVVLLVLAGLGGIVWGAMATPLTFQRWSRADTDHGVLISRADTYVIYEEYPGAAGATSASPIQVSVREVYGTDVSVRMLQRPGQPTAVPAYADPWHEGRAIAEFDVTRTGPYRIQVSTMASGTFDPDRYGPVTSGSVAVGRKLSTTWLNTPQALLPLVVLPVAGAVALFVTTRRRRSAAA